MYWAAGEDAGTTVVLWARAGGVDAQKSIERIGTVDKTALRIGTC